MIFQLLDKGSWRGLGAKQSIVQFASGQEGVNTEPITQGLGPPYHAFAKSQDTISWQRFMEGMISESMLGIQGAYLTQLGST